MQSSFAMLPLFTPSISTKTLTCPCELVIVHGGPGETQPGGVAPGVSQRFACPTGEVIPGLKMLFDREEDPVILSVMSVILTIQGEEQETRGFHEPEPIGNWAGLTAPAGYEAPPIVDKRRTPNSMVRVSQDRLDRTIVQHPSIGKILEAAVEATSLRTRNVFGFRF